MVACLSAQTNPKYWDDEDAEDVEDAYGDDWEKVAAFQYDNVEYSMVKILEPVLILAKEDPVSSSLGAGVGGVLKREQGGISLGTSSLGSYSQMSASYLFTCSLCLPW